MLTMTITDRLESRLKSRALANGRSVEEEALQILDAALPADVTEEQEPTQNLADAIASLFEPLGGVDLDLDWLRRQPSTRKPPTFE